MSEPPTCFLDLPPDTVRLMLASLDIWTTAADDLAFVRWWNAMALSCRWLNSICKTYEPQMCKAAAITGRASLILTPKDPKFHGYHELLPYCKMDRKPEQLTKIPEKLLEQSDFLRTSTKVRLDGPGLPQPSDLRWMLWNLDGFSNLRTLQLCRPEHRLDMMLPVLNEWLRKPMEPFRLQHLSLCRWPGIDFKAVAAFLECTCSLTKPQTSTKSGMMRRKAPGSRTSTTSTRRMRATGATPRTAQRRRRRREQIACDSARLCASTVQCYFATVCSYWECGGAKEGL